MKCIFDYDRGQESAGLVTSYGDDAYQVSQYKGMGLVNQVFKEEHLVKLKGNVGIGMYMQYIVKNTNKYVRLKAW